MDVISLSNQKLCMVKKGEWTFTLLWAGRCYFTLSHRSVYDFYCNEQVDMISPSHEQVGITKQSDMQIGVISVCFEKIDMGWCCHEH